MYKLLRIALFAAPLAGGAAWAQGSGTSGSAPAPGTSAAPSVTDDTRTPLQQKAGRMDDTTPVLPGDATKPLDVPNTVPDSNATGIPDTSGMTAPGSRAHDKNLDQRRRKQGPSRDESTIERKSDADRDTTRMQNKSDSDLTKDQLDSDK
jgi:hypothetical protein